MRRGLLVVAAAAALAAGCGGHQRAATPTKAPSPSVRTLSSVDELRTLFNAHPGVPRLIVLVSPT